MHEALAEVQSKLASDSLIFAYFDDVYVIAEPARVKEVCDMLSRALKDRAGISLNEAKTRTWNRA
eukprot:1450647-Karenia_brevis.AAC.1